jgi:uncharacterized membrane protein YdbT with pleckstrin-like domain
MTQVPPPRRPPEEPVAVLESLTPSPRYLRKLLLVMSLIAALVLVGALFAFGDDPGFGLLIFLLNLAWYFPALFLTRLYYRSLKYEIQDDEVIVQVGIWTRSIKHVPFRTVTNLKINRDIFDRWFFDLGSLNIQTAGMSGTSGAEEALVGLPNVQDVYEIVQTRLRGFRGAMAPTAAEEDGEAKEDAFKAILTEVRAIRKAVEK